MTAPAPASAPAPIEASAAVGVREILLAYKDALWATGVQEAEAIFALRWTILGIQHRTKDQDHTFSIPARPTAASSLRWRR